MLRSLFFGADSSPNYIFPTVNPEQDGPDCRRDCTSCTAKLPSKFKIDTAKPLYGHIKEFSNHVLVATGKADWIPKVKQDKGSLMEAFAQTPVKSRHGVRSFAHIASACPVSLSAYMVLMQLPENYGFRVQPATG